MKLCSIEKKLGYMYDVKMLIARMTMPIGEPESEAAIQKNYRMSFKIRLNAKTFSIFIQKVHIIILNCAAKGHLGRCHK